MVGGVPRVDDTGLPSPAFPVLHAARSATAVMLAARDAAVREAEAAGAAVAMERAMSDHLAGQVEEYRTTTESLTDNVAALSAEVQRLADSSPQRGYVQTRPVMAGATRSRSAAALSPTRSPALRVAGSMPAMALHAGGAAAVAPPPASAPAAAAAATSSDSGGYEGEEDGGESDALKRQLSDMKFRLMRSQTERRLLEQEMKAATLAAGAASSRARTPGRAASSAAVLRTPSRERAAGGGATSPAAAPRATSAEPPLRRAATAAPAAGGGSRSPPFSHLSVVVPPAPAPPAPAPAPAPAPRPALAPAPESVVGVVASPPAPRAIARPPSGRMPVVRGSPSAGMRRVLSHISEHSGEGREGSPDTVGSFATDAVVLDRITSTTDVLTAGFSPKASRPVPRMFAPVEEEEVGGGVDTTGEWGVDATAPPPGSMHAAASWVGSAYHPGYDDAERERYSAGAYPGDDGYASVEDGREPVPPPPYASASSYSLPAAAAGSSFRSSAAMPAGSARSLVPTSSYSAAPAAAAPPPAPLYASASSHTLPTAASFQTRPLAPSYSAYSAAPAAPAAPVPPPGSMPSPARPLLRGASERLPHASPAAGGTLRSVQTASALVAPNSYSAAPAAPPPPAAAAYAPASSHALPTAASFHSTAAMPASSARSLVPTYSSYSAAPAAAPAPAPAPAAPVPPAESVLSPARPLLRGASERLPHTSPAGGGGALRSVQTASALAVPGGDVDALVASMRADLGNARARVAARMAGAEADRRSV